MSQSTWHNTLSGMYAATHDAYMSKSSTQRNKREVQKVMADMPAFCQRKQAELRDGRYKVGRYRHFRLRDKKKTRFISVLPYEDRCVQNAVKDAFEPLVLRQMTDDMLGGLPGCGVLASDRRHQVVARMKRALNNCRWQYMMQGDITKFYDNIDNVLTMQQVERCVKDKRTRALIRQHLFNQKRLAIGDPFSHLLANLNMSVIIRKAKAAYGNRIEIINFADDFIAFAADKETLTALRRDMRRWAKERRLHYKPMYIRPIPGSRSARRFSGGTSHRAQRFSAGFITFCGYRYRRGATKLTRRTKLRYIKARHKSRSMGSYNGILQVADTKHLRYLVEQNNNRHMADKIRRPFAGKPKKVEQLEGIRHTIVDKAKKPSRQQHTDTYYHVQAIADGLGLIVYSTSSSKIVDYLETHDIPLRDMVIAHDWSGFYYEGTVYTDEEEEAMIREKFNIPK